MKCKKCASENVNVQTVGDVSSKGGAIPFWYWISFAWMIDLILYCCIIGFFGVNINHIFKRTKTKIRSYVVCQDCGYSWEV